MSQNDILTRAREVFDIEINGLQTLRDSLGEAFSAVVACALETLRQGGKLVWTGIGKSGYIGKKIAATMSSVGAPSIFMHPVEALHGDLGIVQEHDLVLALSYSGETTELLRMITYIRRFGLKVAAITGNAESHLARLADVVLPMPIPEEACPFKLAPTTSTTALLALGDALAMVLLQERHFTRENYGRLHPGGAIGLAVTLKVSDIARTGDRCAVVKESTPLRDALCRMSEARCGAAIVTDADDRVVGIFTDGDFRRLAKADTAVLDRRMGDIMTRHPATIRADALAVEVMKTVEQRRINSVIAVDADNRVVGLVDVQDLPGLKLI